MSQARSAVSPIACHALSPRAGSALQIAVLATLMIVTVAGALTVVVASGHRHAEQAKSQLNSLYLAESGIKDTWRQMNVAAAADAREETEWSIDDGDVFSGEFEWGAYTCTANEIAGTENWRLVSTGTSSSGSNRDSKRVIEVVLEALTKNKVFNRFGFALFSDLDLTLSGRGFTDSYDSRVGSYSPSAASAPFSTAYQGTKGNIGSNGDIINPAGSSEFHGDINPGFESEATIGGVQDPGSETEPFSSYQELEPVSVEEYGPFETANDNYRLPTNIYTAATRTLSVGAGRTASLGNPAGEGSAPYTYFFDEVSSSGSGAINIVGPTVIYLNGPWNNNGSSTTNMTLAPPNLLIYGIGGPHDFTLNGSSGFGAGIYAPGHNLTFNGAGDMRGAYTGRSIRRNGNWNFHYDEALGDLGGGAGEPAVIGFDILGWYDRGNLAD